MKHFIDIELKFFMTKKIKQWC